MFKIPDWEDAPKSNVTFSKSAKQKNQKNKCATNDDNTKNRYNSSFRNRNDKKTIGKYVMNPNFEEHKTKFKIKQDLNSRPGLKKSKLTEWLKNEKKNINKLKLARKLNKDSLKSSVNDAQIYNRIKIKTKNKSRKQKLKHLNTDSTSLNNEYEETLISNANNTENVHCNTSKQEKCSKTKENYIEKHNPTISKGKVNKASVKKEKIRKLLKLSENNSSVEKSSSFGLRERMLEKLKAAQFRFINEKLYTSSGQEACKLFQEDPAAFHAYHQGYQQQLSKWPLNPLDVIVQKIMKLPKSHLIADMGCGQAMLAKRVPHKVRSFDLVSSRPEVEACDMAHTPLLASSVDVAVYCLALMGTNLAQYLAEANRVLKDGGQLIIAEVESRFDNLDEFLQLVQRLGFKVNNVDKTHQVFYFLYFAKVRPAPVKKSKLPNIHLKPCIYKKR